MDCCFGPSLADMAAMADKHHVGESTSLPEGGRLHVKIQVRPELHVPKMLADHSPQRIPPPCSSMGKSIAPCGASVHHSTKIAECRCTSGTTEHD